MYKIVIPGELPGMNEIITAAKNHYGQYSNMKKLNTRIVKLMARKLPKHNKIFLDITWYCKDKRKDPDNIASGGSKFIWDGLVEAGVIENDGWKQNGGQKDTFKVDRKDPRIEIIITEVGNET